MPRSLPAFALAAALTVFGLARGVDAQSEADSEGIVVTGTRTEHTESDAPVPTQVITREEIDATATASVEDVLLEVPDLYIRRNEEFGLGASTLRMQGLDANKAAVLLDGRRFRGGIDGVVDLRDIAVGGIEQVEIVRGPASSLYGSDAMAGVVNIRTRQGSDDLWMRAEAAAGSAGRQIYSGSIGHHAGPLRYFLSAQHDEVEIGQLYAGLSRQYEGSNANDAQTRNGVRARVDTALGVHDLGLLTDYQIESNPLSDSDDLGADLRWRWTNPGTAGGDSSLGLYRHTRENTLEGFAEDLRYLDMHGESQITRPIGSLFGADHVAVAGLRGRGESLESAASEVEGFPAPAIDEGAWLVSPFLQNESLLGANWSLVLGASVDIHQFYGAQVNPRATLTWRPTDNWQLSATVGRGYRAPDLRQLFDVDVNNVVVHGDRVTGYAIVGNPDLEPETDLGTTLFAEYRGLRGAVFSLDGFRHDLDDGIGFALACSGPTTCTEGFRNPVPDLDGPVFTYRNISAAVTQGLDVTVQTRPLQWWPEHPSSHDVDVTIAGGYLHTENLGDIPGERGQRLPFRPSFRVLASVTDTFLPTRTSLRLWADVTGDQYTDLANSHDGQVPTFTTINARFSQDLGALASKCGLDANRWLSGFELYVHASNLADERVDNLLGVGGPLAMVPRRNVVAGLRWTLGGATSNDPQGETP